MARCVIPLCTVLAGLSAAPAVAQVVDPARSAPPQAEDARDPTVVEEVVVTGSRAAPRAATETSAPVEAYSAEELQARGLGDLSRSLQLLSPSVNFAGAVNAGAAANTRGPTLRGLGQDQVLVLIDGKRRHASSLINFNNTVGRGQVPVDLNLIPVSAIQRVEVLRDGAAAQYGSDAIAGVINIILRKDASGGFGSTQVGVTEEGDGLNFIAALQNGFELGDGGALTLTGEVRQRSAINRAAVDSRFGRVTNQQGDNDALDLNLSAAFDAPMASVTVYGNALFAHRDAETTVQYRVPSVAPVLFPAGFLPLISLDLVDFGGTLGATATVAGWRVDLSDTAGYSRADFEVGRTTNTALGLASPSDFDSGGARYTQNLVNLTASRSLDLLADADLSVGVEHRYETYEIRSGEPASFTGAGAQGFAGFNPPTPVDESRSAVSAFVDGELTLIEGLRLSAAGRYEDYEGAGQETTTRLSLFYRPLEQLALRATASTGFRAPSLQQSFFSTVTSQSSAGVLVNVGTFAVSDPVAQALGARDLRPETSETLSAGLVWTPLDGLTIAVDAFRVDIVDRIALSESLQGPPVLAILTRAGITSASQVRFFTNAADTQTQGFDVTADYRRRLSAGELRLGVGYNASDTDIESLRSNPVIPTLPLLATASIDFLTKAQPRNKLNAYARWEAGRYEATVDLNRYGSFRFLPVVSEQTFGPETTLDVTGSIRLTTNLTLAGGVLNATDTFADLVAERALTQGGGLPYPEAGGLGFRGREYFVRLRADF